MLDFDTEIFIRDLQNFWIKKKVLVVHCGAHLAEELAEYKHFNFDPVIWIESPITAYLLPYCLSARTA